MEDIKILYHNKNITKLTQTERGDWIDLRAAETVEIKKGENKIISLGVSMKIPDGYEAHIAPRSSTFKNFKITMSNSIGIVDQTYCSSNDIWGFPALAWEDTVIHEGDRICQFRIMQKMPKIDFVEVESLDYETRGGFGSSGTK